MKPAASAWMFTCGLLLAWSLLSACSEPEPAAAPPSRPSAEKPATRPPVPEAPPNPPPPEALVPLSSQDFSPQVRDPFQTYMSQQLFARAQLTDKTPRHLVFSAYDLEDLRVVAVVHTGNQHARALLVANDGRSESAVSGDFLSRAQVRVMAITARGVEVEVVDEVLAAGLGMTRGERRILPLSVRGRS